MVGVDSGRLTLTDYPNEPEVLDVWGKMEAAGWPLALQLNFKAGHAGAGVTVSTGFGDGLYPVFVRKETLEGLGERIAEVKVVFLP